MTAATLQSLAAKHSKYVEKTALSEYNGKLGLIYSVHLIGLFVFLS